MMTDCHLSGSLIWSEASAATVARRRSHLRPDASLAEAFLFVLVAIHRSVSAASRMALAETTKPAFERATSFPKGSCTRTSRGDPLPLSKTA